VYGTPNIVRARWAGHVACTREIRNAYTVLVGKPEGKRPLERRSGRWEYISMDLMEIECEGMDWLHLAQDRVQWRAFVNTGKNLRGP